VALPVWAKDEYEFVFKMRKFLECEHITTGLHGWIDLIFGVYAKKEYAIKADNLFLDHLYIDSFKAYGDEKNKECTMYFKEFGQVPVPVINLNCRPAKPQENYLGLLGHPSIKKEVCVLHNSAEGGRLLQILNTKRFTFLLM
jgi:hypothetical protein